MGAKSQAMKTLGSEDDYIGLSALNKEREVAQSKYNTTLNSLQNEYNNLLTDIMNKRQSNLKDFNKGRSTVRENAFMATRSDLSDLASRGLVGGIAQLSKLGNRMETGRQYSDLANTYYNTINELDTSEKRGTDTYNLNLDIAKNDLQSALASIGTREANARNAYKQAVASLAEQIKTRAAAQAQAKAISDANKLAEKAKLATYYKSLLSDNTDSGQILKVAREYMSDTGSNMTEALNWLQDNGVFQLSKVQEATKAMQKANLKTPGASTPIINLWSWR